jgi:adenylate cyclase
MTHEQNVTRKLRAILSADVKGYSLLMADDEVHTIETLKKYRDLMANLIKQHSGRVVDNPGDNLLAEFGSAVDTVECAVFIQNRLKKENARFVEDKRLELRIGINIGDVIQDSGRLYGSSVNVAARIEGLADAGGICLSRGAYDQVKDKIDLGFDYLGEQKVKNLKEPVRVYRVLMDAKSHKSLVEEKLELPDKPSIAVLPFTNMSGDPGQEYFSDGLTEQIINGLCKVSNLFVIARNSSFAYKGKSISVKQIAKELGVRYILEGSVQRDGNRVRITAQLIDATTDYHMWSENYDRDLEDIFALQDEITMKLISVMEINLIYGEQARLWSGVTTKNIRAYEICMKGWEQYYLYNQQYNEQAKRYAEEAIALDVSYPFPHVLLGCCYWIELHVLWSQSPFESFAQMEKCAETALALNDSFDMTYILLGLIQLIQYNHEKAIEFERMAVKLNPNGAHALLNLSYVLSWAGEPEESLDLALHAIRLNPIPTVGEHFILALAYSVNGKYEECIDVCRKALSINPESFTIYLIMTVAYSLIGKYDKARETAKEIIRRYPSYSIDQLRQQSLFKHQYNLEFSVEALRKVGIPEHSPD